LVVGKLQKIKSGWQLIKEEEAEREGGGRRPPIDASIGRFKKEGSSYNALVEWENGEITSEPLSIIAADDPITCAIYAQDNNLLDLEGWKRF